MSALLASLWALLQQAALSVTAKLVASFSTILGNLTTDERQILVDAKTAFLNDIQAGKSPEQAAADALTVFFNEEKGEVNKIVLYFFRAFLAAFGVPQSG
ncbi:MAG TPA: hypothetical protein VHT03_01650 [Rhizomicrobium sp.]|jgi:hypothetical protein|nr:hypothetical protein [Rhizomicrobium sp.]